MRVQGFVKSASRRRSAGRGARPDGLAGEASRSTAGKLMRLVDWSRVVVGGGLALLLLLVVTGWRSAGVGAGGADAVYGQGGLRSGVSSSGKGCDTVWCRSSPTSINFGIVADLDRQSKLALGEKHAGWRSFFKKARLFKDSTSNKWEISWDADIELQTHLGEDGRGLELSELVNWQDRLWTFDDRSGVVFELTEEDSICIPRYILMEGDGNNAKGQKTEWATVKDGKLIVGSFGKPYTQNGVITTRNNLWISIIHPSGAIEHEDWTVNYERMQQDTDSVYPGYMVHEAIHFDQLNRLWYVLPRRVSHDAYDEKRDEVMGSNLMLVYDEHFGKLVKKLSIGSLVPTHGWSSFKFVPFTNNRVILGLRSMEIEDKDNGDGEQNTYVTIFDVDGNVFLEEQLIPGAHKYEGIEFL
ncbi:Soluble calcium-activated nucleotidase 1 [Hondaea fermentalgiana]|uniref:Soluble calcium-activated nucleotidase 1 n=1 Tax=Hondaea fermentalgiana TaxID=2315210 RepID=A0A2R5G5H9_9STRA|nr:Soluble calcium-activated nucleotidase 1 [Hondaea fermentalgiana]|eukprot:GBG26302.1 Soluble calcium-activated nucleotidase 1 [Hondaea fermentalgiana]